MIRPVRIHPQKHFHKGGGKLFRGRGDNRVHIFKELQQRGTLFREVVRLILVNVSSNIRNPVLALGNAMAKNVG
jgi:hypothetical protein